MESLSPLGYENYRTFLNDLCQIRKKSRKRYSYRQFAKDMGFNPSNYFHLIINGKRALTVKAVGTMLSHLDWSSPEKNYFKILVELNDCPDSSKQALLQNKLSHILGKHRTVLQSDQEAYFNHWYIPVLREILALKNAVSHLGWLAKKLRPAISEKEVLEAIKILERLKLIKKSGNRWIQEKKHLTTEPQISSRTVFNYQKEMLHLSANSLNLPSSDRDISAMTMSVNEKQFEWLKKRLYDFRHEIQQELDDDQSDSTIVAQLNMQLFKVTN